MDTGVIKVNSQMLELTYKSIWDQKYCYRL